MRDAQEEAAVRTRTGRGRGIRCNLKAKSTCISPVLSGNGVDTIQPRHVRHGWIALNRGAGPLPLWLGGAAWRLGGSAWGPPLRTAFGICFPLLPAQYGDRIEKEAGNGGVAGRRSGA
jgi:hypothetical protein